VFVSRTNITPLNLYGIIDNLGTSSWTGPVRIKLENFTSSLFGLPTGNPLIFSNPPNAFFDSPAIASTWNTLLDALYLPVPSTGPDTTSAFGAFLSRENSADQNYSAVITPMASTYEATVSGAMTAYEDALEAAKSAYDASLAQQGDPTQADETYWNQLAAA